MGGVEVVKKAEVGKVFVKHRSPNSNSKKLGQVVEPKLDGVAGCVDVIES
jgi:hypothetical protein